jgi:hypothetical protein
MTRWRASPGRCRRSTVGRHRDPTLSERHVRCECTRGFVDAGSRQEVALCRVDVASAQAHVANAEVSRVLIV